MTILRNNHCQLKISKLLSLSSNKIDYYNLELVDGFWPKDRQLVTACDNRSFSSRLNHFGGAVRSTGDKTKEVAVYLSVLSKKPLTSGWITVPYYEFHE